MRTLSDDILNKYIDGELTKEDVKEIEDTIQSSREDKIRLNALRETDRKLRNIKVPDIKSNFTSLVMNRIQKSLRSRQEQKKFILVIVSVFMLMCLTVVGVVGFEMIRNFNPGTSAVLKNSIKYITSASELLANLFSSKNLSIVGGTFSLGLVISAWFFFDFSKSLRKAGK